MSPQPAWTGFEVSSTLLGHWSHPNQSDQFRKSSYIISELAKKARKAGCYTFEIAIGFHIPTQTWRIRMEARVPTATATTTAATSSSQPGIAGTARPNWRVYLAYHFTVFATSEDALTRRSLVEPRGPEWHIWKINNPDWSNMTRFVMYRGLGYIPMKYGVECKSEILKLHEIQERDAGFAGLDLGPTTTASDRTSSESGFLEALEKLTSPSVCSGVEGGRKRRLAPILEEEDEFHEYDHESDHESDLESDLESDYEYEYDHGYEHDHEHDEYGEYDEYDEYDDYELEYQHENASAPQHECRHSQLRDRLQLLLESSLPTDSVVDAIVREFLSSHTHE
ncbi:hypothetical protein BDV18DRAFT_155267 [Aspergillus unguis]